VRALAASKSKRACLVVRKAYTVGLYAMSGPGFDPAYFWAFPGASISVFGPKALDYFAKDRDLPPPALAAIEEMHHHAIHPQDYADKGYLDGVLEFRDARPRLEEFVRSVR
jgi:methylmalonyl-CoA decarboxylase subunit alpha